MPNHRFNLLLTIALVLAACMGCRDFPIEGTPPVAVAGDDESHASGPVDVTLDGSESEDPDGEIVHYEWRYTGDPRGDEGLDDDAGLADVPVSQRPLPDFCPEFVMDEESHDFVPIRWCELGDEVEVDVTLDDGVHRFTLYVTDDDGMVSADSVVISVGQPDAP